jgi:hypothetical protein
MDIQLLLNPAESPKSKPQARQTISMPVRCYHHGQQYRPRVRYPWTIEEDAILLYISANARGSFRGILRIALSRADTTINTRRDALYGYEVSALCPECRRLECHMDRLAYKYVRDSFIRFRTNLL